MKFSTLLLGVLLLIADSSNAGLIKDFIKNVTNNGNKTQNAVEQSAPICGNGIFSREEQMTLSPEIIFIYGKQQTNNRNSGSYSGQRESSSRRSQVRLRAKEFRFHVENVTLEQLEKHGFNRDAPVTFLIHGFTSGYPFQSWMTGIVEAYSIDREGSNQNQRRDYNQNERNSRQSSSAVRPVDHNLFVINWSYAARGLLYPRAVANIPIVASFVTNFINDKLINEFSMDPSRIQLIGHSLGAHLSGYVGKNTVRKLGRIYGLDPAGPCFGSISGPLFPSSQRLSPNDADQVITIHTNSALLGIDKSIGKYSVYVEGGANQPGCKGGGVLKSLSALTWDGSEFDDLACSHSRAPNLLTYRHDQSGAQDDCQLIAYECKDWESFKAGHCGVCDQANSGQTRRGSQQASEDYLKPVECLRLGLDWQYSTGKQQISSNGENYDDSYQSSRSTTSRPKYQSTEYSDDRESYSSTQRSTRTSTGRPRESDQYSYSNNQERDRYKNSSWSTNKHSHDRNRRGSSNTTTQDSAERRLKDQSEESKMMFMRTADTPPFCTFQYQVVLRLNEPFAEKNPSISLVLQDSGEDGEQNSLSSDNFGNKLHERIYTDLLQSSKKLSNVNHATLLFPTGLPEGIKVLKDLQVNYMSHINPKVREKLSSHLCPIQSRDGDSYESANHRFYFEPCSDSR